MANSDSSSFTTCTVRVFVSFYLAAPDDSSSARTSPIHKEKFNVPLSGDEHKDLFNFLRHLKTFTGLAEIAKSKGLGGNPEVTIARVQKAGSGVQTFSLRTQDAWRSVSLTLLSEETVEWSCLVRISNTIAFVSRKMQARSKHVP